MDQDLLFEIYQRADLDPNKFDQFIEVAQGDPEVVREVYNRAGLDRARFDEFYTLLQGKAVEQQAPQQEPEQPAQESLVFGRDTQQQQGMSVPEFMQPKQRDQQQGQAEPEASNVIPGLDQPIGVAEDDQAAALAQELDLYDSKTVLQELEESGRLNDAINIGDDKYEVTATGIDYQKGKREALGEEAYTAKKNKRKSLIERAEGIDEGDYTRAEMRQMQQDLDTDTKELYDALSVVGSKLADVIGEEDPFGYNQTLVSGYNAIVEEYGNDLDKYPADVLSKLEGIDQEIKRLKEDPQAAELWKKADKIDALMGANRDAMAGLLNMEGFESIKRIEKVIDSKQELADAYDKAYKDASLLGKLGMNLLKWQNPNSVFGTPRLTGSVVKAGARLIGNVGASIKSNPGSYVSGAAIGNAIYDLFDPNNQPDEEKAGDAITDWMMSLADDIEEYAPLSSNRKRSIISKTVDVNKDGETFQVDFDAEGQPIGVYNSDGYLDAEALSEEELQSAQDRFSSGEAKRQFRKESFYQTTSDVALDLGAQILIMKGAGAGKAAGNIGNKIITGVTTAGMVMQGQYKQGLEIFDGDEEKAMTYAKTTGLLIGASANLFNLEAKLAGASSGAGQKALAKGVLPTKAIKEIATKHGGNAVNTAAEVAGEAIKSVARRGAAAGTEAAGEWVEESVVEPVINMAVTLAMGETPELPSVDEFLETSAVSLAVGLLGGSASVNNQERNSGMYAAGVIGAGQDLGQFRTQLTKAIQDGSITLPNAKGTPTKAETSQFVNDLSNRVEYINTSLQKEEITGDARLEAIPLYDKKYELLQLKKAAKTGGGEQVGVTKAKMAQVDNMIDQLDQDIDKITGTPPLNEDGEPTKQIDANSITPPEGEVQQENEAIEETPEGEPGQEPTVVEQPMEGEEAVDGTDTDVATTDGQDTDVPTTVESFETAKGSVYTVLPNGKVQRFKTATNEQREPSDLIVFVKFKDSLEEQEFLAAQNRRDGKKLSVIDSDGNVYDTNEQVKGKDVRLAIIKDGKVVKTVETSTTPKVGYNTFDQRRFKKEGVSFRSTHLGNKVTKITSKKAEAPTMDDSATTLPETVSPDVNIDRLLTEAPQEVQDDTDTDIATMDGKDTDVPTRLAELEEKRLSEGLELDEQLEWERLQAPESDKVVAPEAEPTVDPEAEVGKVREATAQKLGKGLTQEAVSQVESNLRGVLPNLTIKLLEGDAFVSEAGTQNAAISDPETNTIILDSSIASERDLYEEAAHLLLVKKADPKRLTNLYSTISQELINGNRDEQKLSAELDRMAQEYDGGTQEQAEEFLSKLVPMLVDGSVSLRPRKKRNIFRKLKRWFQNNLGINPKLKDYNDAVDFINNISSGIREGSFTGKVRRSTPEAQKRASKRRSATTVAAELFETNPSLDPYYVHVGLSERGFSLTPEDAFEVKMQMIENGEIEVTDEQLAKDKQSRLANDPTYRNLKKRAESDAKVIYENAEALVKPLRAIQNMPGIRDSARAAIKRFVKTVERHNIEGGGRPDLVAAAAKRIIPKLYAVSFTPKSEAKDALADALGAISFPGSDLRKLAGKAAMSSTLMEVQNMEQDVNSRGVYRPPMDPRTTNTTTALIGDSFLTKANQAELVRQLGHDKLTPVERMEAKEALDEAMKLLNHDGSGVIEDVESPFNGISGPDALVGMALAGHAMHYAHQLAIGLELQKLVQIRNAITDKQTVLMNQDAPNGIDLARMSTSIVQLNQDIDRYARALDSIGTSAARTLAFRKIAKLDIMYSEEELNRRMRGASNAPLGSKDMADNKALADRIAQEEKRIEEVKKEMRDVERDIIYVQTRDALIDLRGMYNSGKPFRDNWFRRVFKQGRPQTEAEAADLYQEIQTRGAKSEDKRNYFKRNVALNQLLAYVSGKVTSVDGAVDYLMNNYPDMFEDKDYTRRSVQESLLNFGQRQMAKKRIELKDRIAAVKAADEGTTSVQSFINVLDKPYADKQALKDELAKLDTAFSDAISGLLELVANTGPTGHEASAAAYNSISMINEGLRTLQQGAVDSNGEFSPNRVEEIILSMKNDLKNASKALGIDDNKAPMRIRELQSRVDALTGSEPDFTAMFDSARDTKVSPVENDPVLKRIREQKSAISGLYKPELHRISEILTSQVLVPGDNFERRRAADQLIRLSKQISNTLNSGDSPDLNKVQSYFVEVQGILKDYPELFGDDVSVRLLDQVKQGTDPKFKRELRRISDVLTKQIEDPLSGLEEGQSPARGLTEEERQRARLRKVASNVWKIVNLEKSVNAGTALNDLMELKEVLREYPEILGPEHKELLDNLDFDTILNNLAKYKKIAKIQSLEKARIKLQQEYDQRMEDIMATPERIAALELDRNSFRYVKLNRLIQESHRIIAREKARFEADLDRRRRKAIIDSKPTKWKRGTARAWMTTKDLYEVGRTMIYMADVSWMFNQLYPYMIRSLGGFNPIEGYQKAKEAEPATPGEFGRMMIMRSFPNSEHISQIMSVQFTDVWARQVKYWGNKHSKEMRRQRVEEVMQELILDDPFYRIAKDAGLQISQPGSIIFSEEMFRASFENYAALRGWWSKVRDVSEDSMTMAVNMARMSMFKDYILANPRATMDDLQKVARTANIFTGVGYSKSKEDRILNKGVGSLAGMVLSAPRLLVAKLSMAAKLSPYHAAGILGYTAVAAATGPALGVVAAFGAITATQKLFQKYHGKSNGPAHYAAQQLGRVARGQLAALTIAQLVGVLTGADVGDDYKDGKNFLKVQGKNRVIDLTGGYGAILRLLSKMMYGSQIAGNYGREKKPIEQIFQYMFTNRPHPSLSVAQTAFTGKDFFDEYYVDGPTQIPFTDRTLPVELTSRVVGTLKSVFPISVQDFIDLTATGFGMSKDFVTGDHQMAWETLTREFMPQLGSTVLSLFGINSYATGSPISRGRGTDWPNTIDYDNWRWDNPKYPVVPTDDPGIDVTRTVDGVTYEIPVGTKFNDTKVFQKSEVMELLRTRYQDFHEEAWADMLEDLPADLAVEIKNNVFPGDKSQAAKKARWNYLMKGQDDAKGDDWRGLTYLYGEEDSYRDQADLAFYSDPVIQNMINSLKLNQNYMDEVRLGLWGE